MDEKRRSVRVKKTFGIAVLVKLLKTDNTGIEILENAHSYRFNLCFKELICKADLTLDKYNICLLV